MNVVAVAGADASVDLKVFGRMGAAGGLGVVVLAAFVAAATLGGAILGGVGLSSAAKNGLLAVAIVDSVVAADVKAVVPGGSNFGGDATWVDDNAKPRTNGN